MEKVEERDKGSMLGDDGLLLSASAGAEYAWLIGDFDIVLQSAKTT